MAVDPASAPPLPTAAVTSPTLDILAIGDAIVDVLATCDDSFLAERGLEKGSMRLVSTSEAGRLYADMGPAREISGGSAANTMAGAAALGLRAAFVGQTADDQLGEIFAHDLQSLGVTFDSAPLAGDIPTGRCLILITPDAQRTMNTCPGASHELSAETLDPDLIRSASILFLEGYLWGPEKPQKAMRKAAEIARSAARHIAFTLSESLCIPGRREAVLGMIQDRLVDTLFGNEEEVRHLTGCSRLQDSIDSLAPSVGTIVVTKGASGAIAFEGGRLAEVAAAPVEQVVDTTGAGDLFAAGFLAARCRGRPVEHCLKAGTIAAAEVISHFGARPEADLKQLVAL